MYYYKFTELKV